MRGKRVQPRAIVRPAGHDHDGIRALNLVFDSVYSGRTVVNVRRLLPLVPVLAVACYGLADAQSGDASRPKRLVSGTAPRPKWSAPDRAAFFENAADHLGELPSATVTAPVAPNTSASPAPTGGVAWSKLVSAAELEREVEALAKLVDTAVKSPNEFKGGGFKSARRDFTTLAALFGVIAEYDGEVRWKPEGAALRDAFGRAGKNCKVGTDGTYAEAKRRADELAALIRGDVPQLESAAAEFAWNETADRAPLMERLEIARTERLKPWTGGQGEFAAHQAEVAHEAAIAAALSEIIKHAGYDYAEDDGYRQYVNELQSSALAARDAAEQKDFARAQTAVGALGNSCDNCHGDYR